MWYRVFGRSDADVPPAALAAHLHAAGLAVEPHFRGDDLGWTGGELRLAGLDSPVVLDRYLATADDLRDDLNAHAAALEAAAAGPHGLALMEHVALTRQLVVARRPPAGDAALLDRLLDETCRFLAARTAGVYQVDGRGWFDAAGTLLIEET